MVWKKGESGNPLGRPPKPEIQELREALDKVKKEKGISFLVHFIRKAYEDSTVAVALAKKILPDKMNNEIDMLPDSIIVIRPKEKEVLLDEDQSQEQTG